MMETNRSLEKSRRIYARLLNLYPREHRAEYGADMLQLFTDQCRAVKNRRGLFVLWLRAMIDLGANALREHLSAPHRTLGLLEAPPNAPLPWKGVALVLVPGLIFFISQVAQLTGADWFFLMVYRGAFYLILPVLAVWVWKRKFPIWGLMPLGLLVRSVLILGYNLQFKWMEQEKQWRTALRSINRALDLPAVPVETMLAIVMAGMALVCIGLLWWVVRRTGAPRRSWIWLGVFILAAAVPTVWQVWAMRALNIQYHQPTHLPAMLLLVLSNQYPFTYGGFLALILFGALLARRHGQLAALLPLGYLLPTVLFGRMMDEWPAASSPNFTFLLLIGAGTLVYRFLVALAAPLWIVRSANGQKQRCSSAIALIFLIVFQAGCNLSMLYYYYGNIRQASDIYFAISDQLIMAAGIALALALYRPRPVDAPAPAFDHVISPQEDVG